MRVQLLTIGCSAVLAAAAAAPAAANPFLVQAGLDSSVQPERTVVSVPAGDLDLTTNAGEKALKKRVRQAADIACADLLGKTAHPLDDFNCRIAAMGEAKSQVDDLVQLARSGRAPALASAVTLEVRQ